jgi:hypothetical protein
LARCDTSRRGTTPSGAPQFRLAVIFPQRLPCGQNRSPKNSIHPGLPALAAGFERIQNIRIHAQADGLFPGFGLRPASRPDSNRDRRTCYLRISQFRRVVVFVRPDDMSINLLQIASNSVLVLCHCIFSSTSHVRLHRAGSRPPSPSGRQRIRPSENVAHRNQSSVLDREHRTGQHDLSVKEIELPVMQVLRALDGSNVISISE